MTTNKAPEKLGRDPDAPTNVAPQIIRTRDELAALDPDTLVTAELPTREDSPFPHAVAWGASVAYDLDLIWRGPMAVIAAGEHVRAARQALKEAPMPLTDDQTEALANERRVLPVHRTEAGYPNCSTCDGGGCPDCTDPA